MNDSLDHYVLSLCASVLGIKTKTKDISSYDWSLVLDLARRHRVRPLLYNAIINNQISIPKLYFNRLKTEVSIIQKTQLLFTKELNHILNQLGENGISAIPYKGVRLAEMAYGNLGLREFGDIDLLLRRSDIHMLGKVLKRSGYKPEKQIPSILNPLYFFVNIEFNYQKYRGEELLFHVEPHWSIGVKRAGQYLSFNDFLPQTKEASVTGDKSLELTEEGMFLSTCIHHMRSYRYILKELIDLAAMVKRCDNLDWQLIFDKAKDWKIYPTIMSALVLLDLYFILPFPDWVAIEINKCTEIQHKVTTQKHLASGLEILHTRISKTVRHDLSFAEGTIKKIEIILRSLVHYLIQFIFFKR